MRIIFIGSVKFSAYALQELLAINANIVGVCTLSSSSFNSDHQDLSPIAEAASIPVCPHPDLNSLDAIDWISHKSPDVIFCFGWSRLIREPLLSLAPHGIIGFHPAALPANRGRHPIIWSLVLGLNITASTFFKMDEGADSGDILSQELIDIYPTDDALTLYSRITEIALRQIRSLVSDMVNGRIHPIPQNHDLSNTWRKRGPIDGCIDWRMAAVSIHNLIRGLTRPYVGAHFNYDKSAIKVWKSEIVTDVPDNIEPGKILQVSDSRLLVKAGIGAVRLLEYSL